MDAASREPYLDGWKGEVIGEWLGVLRTALGRWPLPGAVLVSGEGEAEQFPLSSGLRQELLRDLHVKAMLDVDHEGGGTIRFEYGHTPGQHRLQALIQLMGAIGTRVELAIGSTAYIRMLRGIVIEREGR